MDDLTLLTKNIPKEAWSQLTKTVCDTFEKLIYPLTATTEGIGQLIQIRFESLNNVQKVIATKCIQEAADKIKTIHKDVVVKPAIIYEALENTDNQTDSTMRTLWANLLAKEFMEGSVHPEIAKLLTKLTSNDALLLLEVAKNDSTPLTIKVLKAIASAYTLGIFKQGKTFNHVHLKNLGLIEDIEKEWYLTTVGRELLKCVSDPQ